jgi:hypothetical protein
MANPVKKLVREPLVHFLLLGAALFAVCARSDHFETGSKSIVVTQGRIDHLANTFTRTWQRPPTQQEMDGLIQDYVREEVYVREAVALGLDRDDLIIRRRLHQKLEFVSEDLAAPAEPSNEELQDYLEAHAATFATERRFSFRQVYLDPERHGVNLARDTDLLLADLRQAGAKTNLAPLGDPLLLEHEFENASAREVTNAFGEKFAAALGNLPPGQWQGPVESAYGAHVVFLAERTEGRLPPLADVREAVRREWSNAQRLEADAQFYQALLRRYSVTIETPRAAGRKQNPARARR